MTSPNLGVGARLGQKSSTGLGLAARDWTVARAKPGPPPGRRRERTPYTERRASYYHRDGGRVAPEAPDSALDPARHAAAALAADLGRGGSRASRRLPFPRRRTDRAPAQSARPGGHEVLDSPRTRSCNRLSALRGPRRCGEHCARVGDRRSDEVVLTSRRFLLYD